jgi:hypothetical protein
MDPHRREDTAWIARRQVDRQLARLYLYAWNKDTLHASVKRSLNHRVAVLVELACLKVGVRIHEHRSAP